jgi:hypothetical protein
MTRSPYIVGPVYDWAFFLLPPTLALALGILLSGTELSGAEVSVWGASDSLAGFFLGAIVHAHLVAVFFRSHANPSIFRRTPLRFTLVPLALFAAIAVSPTLGIVASIVATFWDVWHSGAQTFGFARIYDRNHGTPPELGRRLDFWLNQVLYLGPVLAGVTLVDHLEGFEHFEDAFFTAVPARVLGIHGILAAGVIAGGTIFVAIYVAAQIGFRRRGYRIPFEKVFLLVSTGITSIYTWGFNTWGEAFFIMNLFHAVQYLALVWAVERKNIARVARARRSGVAAALFFGSVAAYGAAVQLLEPGLHVLWSATIVVSLMHFWYDAFVWSVRARQI